MFAVTLRFSSNRAAAGEFMAAHNAWLADGFAAGVFQCAGSLLPEGGGSILAIGESRHEIEARVQADPFVVHDVVAAEIQEIEVKRTSPALDLLKG